MFQEYNKNVRGSRSKVRFSVKERLPNSEGKEMKINRESKYYVNEHYHYRKHFRKRSIRPISKRV